ncbi:hypothetical protein [Microlunatus soli]|uniref:Uncharacterized protein n=1 Tax=Microlunatus soli TaxID=630515 RepID=A0A1H1UQX8_9ACTN|nr:hypothetical protein [Microlunatus soli]SDS74895.1 hypothetical protein SAMN04489812_2896 [Microlunatus soli]
MIGAAIIGAELAFWIVLVLALVCRYLLRRRRLSTIGLLCLPVIDLCLLSFVVVDLVHGAAPQPSHAFAASYLGFTVAFGHSITRWADERFAHRFAGGPKPVRPAKGSAAYVRQLWIEWLRVVLAVGLSALILFGLATVVCRQPVPHSLEQAASSPLWGQMVLLGMVTVIWFLAGPAFARVTTSTTASR